MQTPREDHWATNLHLPDVAAPRISLLPVMISSRTVAFEVRGDSEDMAHITHIDTNTELAEQRPCVSEGKRRDRETPKGAANYTDNIDDIIHCFGADVGIGRRQLGIAG